MCIKSAQKIHKILAHKIHEALSAFFLRHRESECLWLLNSPETGKKFAKKIFTNQREKVYHFENFTSTGKIIFK